MKIKPVLQMMYLSGAMLALSGCAIGGIGYGP